MFRVLGQLIVAAEPSMLSVPEEVPTELVFLVPIFKAPPTVKSPWRTLTVPVEVHATVEFIRLMSMGPLQVKVPRSLMVPVATPPA